MREVRVRLKNLMSSENSFQKKGRKWQKEIFFFFPSLRQIIGSQISRNLTIDVYVRVRTQEAGNGDYDARSFYNQRYTFCLSCICIRMNLYLFSSATFIDIARCYQWAVLTKIEYGQWYTNVFMWQRIKFLQINIFIQN